MADILRVFVLLLSSHLGVGALPFVTTWRTTQPNEEIKLLKVSTQSDVTINWGDSNVESFPAGSTGSFAHNYSLAGLYNVSMDGQFLARAGSPLRYKLIDIVSWGDGFLVDQYSYYLFFAANLRVLTAPPDTQPVLLPGARLDSMFALSSFNSSLDWDLTNATSLASMFEGTPLNKPITFRNTRGVTSIYALFVRTPHFNQPFHFDASGLLDASSLFHSAIAFNQVVNLTNSSQLKKTTSMFYGARSFNQPITFNTDSVTDMAWMFCGASKFNQPVGFNVSQVSNMDNMFDNAREFNQPINFQSSSKLNRTSLMFRSALRFDQPVTMDTAGVTIMYRMFFNASSFASPVNFTSTARVANMEFMFENATNFAQDLSSWDTQRVQACSSFCRFCGLPRFPRCAPCGPSTPPIKGHPPVCATREPQQQSA